MSNFEIENLFNDRYDSFTIYVVSKHFSVGLGKNYFKKFLNSKSYIYSNIQAVSYKRKIINWITKNIPKLSELLSNIMVGLNNPEKIGLRDIITSLNILFTTEEHKAVGPEIIDPIIIEEEKVSTTNIEDIVTINNGSCLQPTIIIILKDNDFDRAMKLLSGCPNNTIAKLIDSSGNSTLYRVINTGANDIDNFLNAYVRQCFSTCSNTRSEILCDSDFTDNIVINNLMAKLLKVRACFLDDKKDKEVMNDISQLQTDILRLKSKDLINNDRMLLHNFECMALLCNIYCADNGQDINKAEKIAKSLDNEMLMAHVYRFYHYKKVSLKEKEKAYFKAEKIFRASQISDHAAYCKNNRLVLSFYREDVIPHEFDSLLRFSKTEVPGLVGMSIIASNAGTAHLYNLNYNNAIDIYEENLHYANCQISQKYGILCNLKIAETLSGAKINKNDLYILARDIIYTFGENKIPFISANLLMNLIGISILNGDTEFVSELLHSEHVIPILTKALQDNQLGSGSLCEQLEVLNKKGFGIFDNINLPKPTYVSNISGKRKSFIEQYGLNPTIHNAWL